MVLGSCRHRSFFVLVLTKLDLKSLKKNRIASQICIPADDHTFAWLRNINFRKIQNKNHAAALCARQYWLAKSTETTHNAHTSIGFIPKCRFSKKNYIIILRVCWVCVCGVAGKAICCWRMYVCLLFNLQRIYSIHQYTNRQHHR